MCQKRYFFFKSDTLVISVVCIIICSKIINETVTWESWLTMRLLHESCMGYLKWLFASPSFFLCKTRLTSPNVSSCSLTLQCSPPTHSYFFLFFSIRKEKLIHLHMSLFFIFYNLSNSFFFSFCWIIISIVIILHVYICICVSK